MFHCAVHTSNSAAPHYIKCGRLKCHGDIFCRCFQVKSKLACWLSHMMKAGLPCPSPWLTDLTAKKKQTLLSIMSRPIPMGCKDLPKFCVDKTDKANGGDVCQAGLSITRHAGSSSDNINRAARNHRRQMESR